MKQLIKRTIHHLQYAVNSFFPKQNQALICEPWVIESNCIDVANYIATNYDFPVYYALPKRLIAHAKNVVLPGVTIVEIDSLQFKSLFFTSKYIFAAHWKFPKYYTNKQVIVNLWHGVGHKKIAMLRGKKGIFANYTVATSELTQTAFTESFGVPRDTVLISGYPRNDIMLRASKNKDVLKKQLKGNLSAYDKIIIWLPTRRKDQVGSNTVDGIPVDNAFQIDNFDVGKYNELLVKHNVLCMVKPHPFDYREEEEQQYSNILTINDEWIWSQGITLYDLTACTDIMVSDVSSIIVDYLLLDQPVICFSTDFDDYKNSRGFYFEDIENWLPSQLVRNEGEFLNYLEAILSTGLDPSEQKRLDLKNAFFTHHDAGSTKRLLETIFSAN
jgi:CDP-glycerol glycerophosphotransferase (TagB/SpsB family)